VALEGQLAGLGLSVRIKGGGLTIHDGRREVKASEVAREFSRRHMEARLGKLSAHRAAAGRDAGHSLAEEEAALVSAIPKPAARFEIVDFGDGRPAIRDNRTGTTFLATGADDAAVDVRYLTRCAARGDEAEIAYHLTFNAKTAELQAAVLLKQSVLTEPNEATAIAPLVTARRDAPEEVAPQPQPIPAPALPATMPGPNSISEQMWLYVLGLGPSPAHERTETQPALEPRDTVEGRREAPERQTEQLSLPLSMSAAEAPEAVAPAPFVPLPLQPVRVPPANVVEPRPFVHPPERTMAPAPPDRKVRRPRSDWKQRRIVLRRYKKELAAQYRDPYTARRERSRVVARLAADLYRAAETRERAEQAFRSTERGANVAISAYNDLTKRQRQPEVAMRRFRQEAGEVYAKPEKALQKIQAYRKKYGRDAVVRAIRAKPKQFGTLCTDDPENWLVWGTTVARGLAPRLASTLQAAYAAYGARPSADELARADEARAAAVSAQEAARSAVTGKTPDESRQQAAQLVQRAVLGGAERADRFLRQLAPMLSPSPLSHVLKALEPEPERDRNRDRGRGLDF
jgi:hypothetical protein